MIFYDRVVKLIVDAVKEKTREATTRLHNRILEIENTNLLFATKKEVERKIEELHSMINTEKGSILGIIEDRISKVASMESVMSLAKGLNNRLDNMYMAMEVTKTQAVNQAKEIFEEKIDDAMKKISENITATTVEIAKNRTDTNELKKIVDSLVPQIMGNLDTSSLTSIIDNLVQAEMKALEERLQSTESSADPNLSGSVGSSVPSGIVTSQYTTPGVYITEEEEPLQG